MNCCTDDLFLDWISVQIWIDFLKTLSKHLIFSFFVFLNVILNIKNTHSNKPESAHLKCCSWWNVWIYSKSTSSMCCARQLHIQKYNIFVFSGNTWNLKRVLCSLTLHHRRYSAIYRFCSEYSSQLFTVDCELRDPVFFWHPVVRRWVRRQLNF